MVTFSELLEKAVWHEGKDAQANDDALRNKIINGIRCIVRALYPITLNPSAFLEQIRLVNILESIIQISYQRLTNQDIADSAFAAEFIIQIFEREDIWNPSTGNSDLFLSIYSSLYSISSQELQEPSAALVETMAALVEEQIQQTQVEAELTAETVVDVNSSSMTMTWVVGVQLHDTLPEASLTNLVAGTIMAIVSEVGPAGCCIQPSEVVSTSLETEAQTSLPTTEQEQQEVVRALVTEVGCAGCLIM